MFHPVFVWEIVNLAYKPCESVCEKKSTHTKKKSEFGKKLATATFDILKPFLRMGSGAKGG